MEIFPEFATYKQNFKNLRQCCQNELKGQNYELAVFQVNVSQLSKKLVFRYETEEMAKLK